MLELFEWWEKLNPHFRELNLLWVQSEIRKHLAMLLSWGYKYIPNQKEYLEISEKSVFYSDFEWQELKSPQIAIMLLEVADFLYTHENNPLITQVSREVVKIPDDYSIEFSPITTTKKDLFWMRSINPSIYCLSKAFCILRAKLEERQTWLYHALFLKTCLMLNREQVPPQFVLWTEFWNIDWLQLTRRYLITDENGDKWIRLHIAWIENYPNLWKDIESLYNLGFTSIHNWGQLKSI